MTPRDRRRSIKKRERANYPVYTARREQFEIEQVYNGWFFWAKPIGWAVNVLKVVGASSAAPGGSLGYTVSDQISETLPTQIAALRWLILNVRDWEDIEYYTTDRNI